MFENTDLFWQSFSQCLRTPCFGRRPHPLIFFIPSRGYHRRCQWMFTFWDPYDFGTGKVTSYFFPSLHLFTFSSLSTVPCSPHTPSFSGQDVSSYILCRRIFFLRIRFPKSDCIRPYDFLVTRLDVPGTLSTPTPQSLPTKYYPEHPTYFSEPKSGIPVPSGSPKSHYFFILCQP